MKNRKLRILLAKLIALIMIISAIYIENPKIKAEEIITLSGKAHVQTYADVDGKYEEGILTLGTRGQGKRVESITIDFENNTGYEGTLQYRVHRQTYGWTEWINAGSPAGTTGQGKRLEGIEMKLTGELAKHYDVIYSVHIQTYGDNQGWVSNGTLAGTTGESKRLEEVRVKIVPKNMETTPTLSYRVHRQTYGWEKTWATDGQVSGTVGQSKRLEGITISVNNSSYDGGITYRTHVQSYGWMDKVSNGTMSGTYGKAKRLEAIEIDLTGEIANHYDVYYRVHAQSFGWLGWAKNGEMSGTVGISKRLEAIQIVLVPEGESIDPNYGGIESAYDKTVMDESDLPKYLHLAQENGQYVVYIPLEDNTYYKATGMDLNLQSHHNYYTNETFEQSMLADGICKMYADVILKDPSVKTDEERIQMAANISAYYSSMCQYGNDEAGHYRSPYGVFVAGIYTCSGSTRALGRILDYMGYSWTHINENQWSHQWCEIKVNGKTIRADGQVGIVYTID